MFCFCFAVLSDSFCIIAHPPEMSTPFFVFSEIILKESPLADC